MGTITIKDGNDIYTPAVYLYLDRLGGFLRRERPTVEGRDGAAAGRRTAYR
jgi:hypothetical protein